MNVQHFRHFQQLIESVSISCIRINHLNQTKM